MDQTQRRDRLSYTVPRHLVVILATAALIFLRNHDLFLAGQFVAEDSFFFYSTAYNKSFIASFTTPYAGYLHLVPMMVAELLWNLPFAVLPWANHTVAIIICSACLSWLYVPACRSLIPSDRLRLACIPLLALAPFQPNVGMILGLHWYLTYMVTLMLLCDPPRRPTGISLASLLAVLAAWTAPALAVLAPIAAFRWYQYRRTPSRFLFLTLGVAVTAHGLAAAAPQRLLKSEVVSCPSADRLRVQQTNRKTTRNDRYE